METVLIKKKQPNKKALLSFCYYLEYVLLR